mmetsp:Transcript_4028/g.12915  ORF Transcript_4028/g.12915 Transcript_4028/m.12915 type:complete len:246 (+) Transcript_4028:310-1047(+)
MTTSTPRRTRTPWSCTEWPPTMAATRTSECSPSFFTSSSICSASSRVGAMMSARGPSSPTRSRMRAGSPRMYSTMGMTNAAVLPEPVSAMPMMSRLRCPIGMACIWIGVGFSYPASRIARIRRSSMLLSAHDRMGLAARPPLIRMSWSSRKMRQSRSDISAGVFSDQCRASSPSPARDTFSSMRRSASRICASSRSCSASRSRRSAPLISPSARASCASSCRRLSSSASMKRDDSRCVRMSMPAR